MYECVCGQGTLVVVCTCTVGNGPGGKRSTSRNGKEVGIHDTSTSKCRTIRARINVVEVKLGWTEMTMQDEDGIPSFTPVRVSRLGNCSLDTIPYP